MPLLLCCLLLFQVTDEAVDSDRQAELRGSVTPERQWWDLQHYHLDVQFFPATKTIYGSNKITFRALKPGKRMQIDLQEPLEITRVAYAEKELAYEREGNVYWIDFDDPVAAEREATIDVEYSGKPIISKNPPWSGGLTWTTDEKDRPFICTTCQGIGASIWWPTKDHGYDEPDNGMNIDVTVPETLVAVSNGRLLESVHNEAKETKTYKWKVTQPINNYCINVNIGHYVNFKDQFDGEAGKLDVSYWVLDHQRELAAKHFKEVPRTLKAFEHWFGKYPFYEDSYKLVVVPYPGMEHQSSVTYGNGFKNGYRGRDLSDTGVGFKFDFIIVHESGHEWFGNNVSMKDTADMWIHEGFTNYSENLFVEYHFTEKEAQDYVIGCRRLVKNDKPIIGEYGLNREGSGDMYYKAGNMLHTMRHIVGDDKKWRTMLRGLNKTFWHSTVTTQQIESYISKHSDFDFSKIFDQYLRTTDIPKLTYAIDGKKLSYKFDNVVDGLRMPLRISANGQLNDIVATEKTQKLELDCEITTFEVDRNFYVETQQLEQLD